MATVTTTSSDNVAPAVDETPSPVPNDVNPDVAPVVWGSESATLLPNGIEAVVLSAGEMVNASPRAMPEVVALPAAVDGEQLTITASAVDSDNVAPAVDETPSPVPNVDLDLAPAAAVVGWNESSTLLPNGIEAVVLSAGEMVNASPRAMPEVVAFPAAVDGEQLTIPASAVDTTEVASITTTSEDLSPLEWTVDTSLLSLLDARAEALFRHADRNNDGTLSHTELKRALKESGVREEMGVAGGMYWLQPANYALRKFCSSHS